jgi:hypothetical protein
MADLKSLYDLNQTESELRNRITQATQIVATEIVLAVDPLPADHAARKSWAVAVIGNPEHWGAIMTRFLVAQYHTAEIAAITGADKDTLLGVVRDVVSVFAAEHAGG